MPALYFVCYLWALPNTLIGLILAVIGRWQSASWHQGALVVHVKWLAGQRWYPGVHGQTFGAVILVKTSPPSDSLLEHEGCHVRQQLLLGPLWFIAYPCASWVAYAKDGDPYTGNYFEVRARAAAADWEASQTK